MKGRLLLRGAGSLLPPPRP